LCADAGPSNSAQQQQQQPHKKLSKVEELMQKDLQAKQRHAAAAAAPAAPAAGGASSSGRGDAVNGSRGRVDHWMYEGIVVKVLSKALKEQGYYKQKVWNV
jgi:DNA/RNA-binding protein KIN17